MFNNSLISVKYLLYVNLDIFLEVVAVKVEHKIMNEVETVAHNDERKLISEFCFLQEILHTLRAVAVAFSAYSFHLHSN